VVNALVTFFGSSYVWFPGEAVVAAGYRTEGVAHVPSAWWGAFVMASAFALLIVAVVGLRPNRAWARRAALYEFVFLFLVVVIEPDPVFPTLFGIILGVALWRLHRAAGGQRRISTSTKTRVAAPSFDTSCSTPAERK
jgi:hypothetical protein